MLKRTGKQCLKQEEEKKTGLTGHYCDDPARGGTVQAELSAKWRYGHYFFLFDKYENADQ